MNYKVNYELKHIDVTEKDFRMIYQHKRLSNLKKDNNAPTMNSLLEAMNETKCFPKVDVRIFVPDIWHVINQKLPKGCFLEVEDKQILQWCNLPAGKTLAILREKDNEKKDFIGWSGSSKTYALSAWQLDNGTFDFMFTSSFFDKNKFVNKVIVSNKQEVYHFPWNLECEIARYNKFVVDLTSFLL